MFRAPVASILFWPCERNTLMPFALPASDQSTRHSSYGSSDESAVSTGDDSARYSADPASSEGSSSYIC